MVPVSALHGANIDKLAEEIQRHMEPMVGFGRCCPKNIHRLNAAYAGNLIPLEFRRRLCAGGRGIAGQRRRHLTKYYVKNKKSGSLVLQVCIT